MVSPIALPSPAAMPTNKGLGSVAPNAIAKMIVGVGRKSVALVSSIAKNTPKYPKCSSPLICSRKITIAAVMATARINAATCLALNFDFIQVLYLDNACFCDILHVVKIKLLIGLVVVVLLGAGGYVVLSSKKGSLPSSSTSGGNVFSSIKDALSKSVSLECNFTDEDGRQTKAYIKAGAVRSDFTGKTANESGSVIMKDKKMYFWSSQGGFMMDVPDEKPAAGQPKEEGLPSTGADVMKTLEQYKDSCKPAVVSDSLFTPPANITFQDFSKMMQQTTPGAAGSVAVPTIDYSNLPVEPPVEE